MSDYSIRKARKKDAPRISQLLLEWLPTDPDCDRADSIEESISKQEISVAVSDSRVVGFIHFVVHDDIIDGAPNAFITAFYVTEAHRGRGMGSALLDSVLATAKAKGCTEIETSASDRRAIRFYEAHGFRQYVGDTEEVFLERSTQT